MLKVLIADDEPAVCAALASLFGHHGIPALVARTPDEALAFIAHEDVGVVLQDMNFSPDATSGAEGIALMRAIRRLDPDIPVVIMTGFTSIEEAVQLVKEGATDYIAKPWDGVKLVASVRNLLRLRELQQENTRIAALAARSQRALAGRYDLRGLVYASAAMHEVVSLAVKVASADAAVLITGPNGSGKERLAQIIQANSRRRDRPFVTVNAGGLPDELLEAELFGAEAGAYTGATRTRVGRFEEANGGTLFLDEIGNLTPSGQVKLLRVLQTGEYQRLGSNVTRRADVRILSATNADLPRMIEEGTFREDLYFRLNVIEIAVPPLCDRVDDILPLADHFFAAQAERSGASPLPQLTFEARQALLEHEWPGNVRELENRIQRALLVRRSESITAEDLGLGPASPRPPRPSSSAPPAPPPAGPLAAADASERAEIERALIEARGVVARAAAMLGISRQAMYRRMDRLGVELERRPRA
ncbi:MAG: sigma-54-dependent Fis family transcriptional regulator [Polyangiaceae bacterium]|nr:sigma-54-dependent Fis family transcriptional regulator [Polyangiaceae bacterium]